MRTVTCQEAGRIRLETQQAPDVGPGELLLDLVACGLCGTDLVKIARGSHRGKVLGHEVVGTVREVGPGVSGFSVGDRVVTPHHVACGACRLCRAGATTRCLEFRREQLEPGGFSEQILVGSRAVAAAARRVPSSMATETAVFLEPAACVLRGLDRSGVSDLAAREIPTCSIVMGAGSMGLLHLLVLNAIAPSGTVVVSEPEPSRRRRARDLGALAVAPEELEKTVAQATDGVGADAVFDTVGSPPLLPGALALMRAGGSLVLFAHFTSHEGGALHEALFQDEKRVMGTYSGSVEEQRRIFELFDQGRLDPAVLITHRLPLARFQQALELARNPAALKILLTSA